MKLASLLVLLISIQHTEASPLFEESSGQPLVVVIKTDLHKIRNERSDYHTSSNNYLDGSFQLGATMFDIKLQTRGHNRLARCQFPPLRVHFDKSEIKNSLLKHNHNLKVVTHCEEEELDHLFREYLVYKLYNSITPYSFQVRLLRIQYFDIDQEQDAIETYAFLIESTNSVEKRLNLDELESDQDFNMKTYAGISEDWINISQLKLQDAFQHLIRNNDWVIFYTQPTSTLSSANIKFFHNEREGFPFPYDFDLAGIVTWNTEDYQYRYGNEDLCENVEMIEALTRIMNHKDGYFQLLEQDSLLGEAYKRDLASYLDKIESVDSFCSEIN